MSETDKEFVERMRRDEAYWPTYEAERLFSLALRGADKQWKPIEGAPKDGTLLLVSGGGGCGIARWAEDKGEILVAAHPKPRWEAYDNSGWSLDWSCRENWFEFTHFIPLSALGEPSANNSLNPIDTPSELY